MSWVVGLPDNSYKPNTNSQLQVIKFTSCLPVVGGSLRVLWLLPPLKLVTVILLRVALNTINQSMVQQSNDEQNVEEIKDFMCNFETNQGT